MDTDREIGETIQFPPEASNNRGVKSTTILQLEADNGILSYSNTDNIQDVINERIEQVRWDEKGVDVIGYRGNKTKSPIEKEISKKIEILKFERSRRRKIKIIILLISACFLLCSLTAIALGLGIYYGVIQKSQTKNSGCSSNENSSLCSQETISQTLLNTRQQLFTTSNNYVTTQKVINVQTTSQYVNINLLTTQYSSTQYLISENLTAGQYLPIQRLTTSYLSALQDSSIQTSDYSGDKSTSSLFGTTVHNCIGPDFVICPNSTYVQCIYKCQICDLYQNCPGGTDEMNCSSYNCPYPIKPTDLCDGIVDCPDSRDELNCICKSGDFHCDDTLCISPSKVCNGVPDCPDSSDETNCTCGLDTLACSLDIRGCYPSYLMCYLPFTCLNASQRSNCACDPSYQFQCLDGSCVYQSSRCDRVEDCPDSSDEQNCPCKSDQITCPSKSSNVACIQKEWMCDGHRDCPNGWDESNCDHCNNSTHFTCAYSNYACRPISERCDGAIDCPDNTDEIDCWTISLASNRVLYGLDSNGQYLPVCASNWNATWTDSICRLTGNSDLAFGYGSIPSSEVQFSATININNNNNKDNNNNNNNNNNIINNNNINNNINNNNNNNNINNNNNNNDNNNNNFNSNNKKFSSAIFNNYNYNTDVTNNGTWNSSSLDLLRSYIIVTGSNFNGYSFNLTSMRIVMGCPNNQILTVKCQPKQCGNVSTFSQFLSPNSMPYTTATTFLTSYIIGGQTVREGQWPSSSALLRNNIYICSAVIIDAQWLLSAAHCFVSTQAYDKNAMLVTGSGGGGGTSANSGKGCANFTTGLRGRAKVMMDRVPWYFSTRSGSTSRYADALNAQTIRLSKIYIHPSYSAQDPPNNYNDLALIKLERPLTLNRYVAPSCLPDVNSGDLAVTRNLCYAVGWGLTSTTEGGSSPPNIRQAKMNVMNDKLCSGFYPSRNISTQMCVGYYMSNDITACVGDSGGPLLCQDANSRWVVRGIVSYGPTSFGTCYSNKAMPTVFTKVSFFADWIKATMSEDNRRR